MSNSFCRPSLPPPALNMLAFFFGSTPQVEVRLGAKLVKHATLSVRKGFSLVTVWVQFGASATKSGGKTGKILL